MDRDQCATCPLRPQCVGGNGPRTLRVRADEARIQAKRREQATAAWQAHYHTRSRIEHVNAEMTRHGGRHGRYWGLRKTLFQERVCAFAYNLKELFRMLGAQWSSPGRVRPRSA